MKSIKARLFSVLALMVLVVPLGAGAVSVDQNIELVLPSTGDAYTLNSGSAFETLVISGGEFKFTMIETQSITLYSSAKRNFTNDLNIATECQSTQSRLFVSRQAGTATSTFGVRPSGTCSSSSTSDSGGLTGAGGSGGGGGAPAPPPPPPAPSRAPAPIPAPAPAPVPVAAAPALDLTRTLGVGSQGSDVAALQAYLAADPSIYPQGTVSGYFGSLTRAAVQRFQEKYGIAKAGDPGYGIVGPKTRAKIRELTLQAAPLPAPAPAPTPIPPSAGVLELSRNLSTGSQGDEVRSLQEYLAQDPLVYPQGTVSGYFGSLTRAAVQRFQEKYGIAKAGDPGYGIVGPKTRAKIRELTSVGATLSPAAQPATQEALIQSIQQQILLLQEQIKKLQGQ